MSDFLKRLQLTNSYPSQSLLPSAIFGNLSQLAQSIIRPTTYKIAVFPCVSEQNTEAIMGFWTLFSYLLEQTNDAKVYRLFLIGENIGESYEWSVEDSQFTPEEGELGGLNENVGIWGECVKQGNQSQLNIYIENDLDDTIKTLSFEYVEIEDLVKQLANIVLNVFDTLEIAFDDVIKRIAEEVTLLPTSSLNHLMIWEANLQGYLWDTYWDESLVNPILEQLGSPSNDYLGQWGSIWALSRVFAPAYNDLDDGLRVKIVKAMRDSQNLSDKAVSAFANAIYKFGHSDTAQQILRDNLPENSTDSEIGVNLASLYFLSGKVLPAIDTYQILIKVNSSLRAEDYRQYARLVQAAIQYNLSFVNELAPEKSHLDEVVAAYRKAIDIAHNAEDYYALLVSIWDEEATIDEELAISLIQFDETGEYVKQFTDLIVDSEHIETLLTHLETRMQNSTESITAKISLAYAYTQIEEYDAAIELLDSLEASALTSEQAKEVVRLRLESEFEDFSLTLSEIEQVIDAGNAVPNAQIQFLEEVIEIAPMYQEAYFLSAKAYMSIEDFAASIEVLLDAQKVFGNTESVVILLFKSFTETKQDDMALQALISGAKDNPTSASILALLAREIFEVAPEKAKIYLRKVESLDPNNAELRIIKQYISDRLSKGL